jgi:hypothetical protein
MNGAGGMATLAGWTGFGLIIFGAILVMAQIFGRSVPNAPKANLLGASFETTSIGLMIMFFGVVLLATAAFGKKISN